LARPRTARDHRIDTIEAEVAALIDRAVEMARAAPPPAEADLLSDVYAS